MVPGSIPGVRIFARRRRTAFKKQLFGDIQAAMHASVRCVVGLVVRISAFQADGPGSIPGQRILSRASQITLKVVSGKPTPKGFEPSRAEPSGFLVHLLNHSDTVSRKASSGPNWIIAITELQTNVNLTKITPCRTRTYNLWIRSPTRYPITPRGLAYSVVASE